MVDTNLNAIEEDRNRVLYERYGIDLETLKKMYEDWHLRSVPKSVVEARYLRTRKHHGKLFNLLVRTYLGIETQQPHPLRERVNELELEVARLRHVLEVNEIKPESAWDFLNPHQERLFDDG